MPSAMPQRFLLLPKHQLRSESASSSGTYCTAPHKARFSEVDGASAGVINPSPMALLVPLKH